MEEEKKKIVIPYEERLNSFICPQRGCMKGCAPESEYPCPHAIEHNFRDDCELVCGKNEYQHCIVVNEYKPIVEIGIFEE